MKKLLLVCLFVTSISAVSFAQGGFQQPSPAERAAALKTSLALNDAQTAKITVIYEAQKKSTDSLMATNTGGVGDMQAMQAMMAKFTPITNAANAKIKAVLTADQAAAFQKQLDARAERMKQFMQQQQGGGAPPKR